jgi:sec-independent protein translocase protein TatB
MFDIGFSELVLVALLALVVLGPKRLPEAARTAGKWMAKLRNFVSEVRHDLDREMRNAEILELQKLKQELDDTRRVMEETSGNIMQKIGAVAHEEPSIGGTQASTPASASTLKRPAKKSRTKKKTPSPKAQNGRTRTIKRV